MAFKVCRFTLINISDSFIQTKREALALFCLCVCTARGLCLCVNKEQEEEGWGRRSKGEC